MVSNINIGKPFQLQFVRRAQMMLFANVLCDPPLGNFTVVPFHQKSVCFTVLIESNKYFSEQQWEAVLWHNCCESGEWNELSLQEMSIDQGMTPLVLNAKARSNAYRRYFSGNLPRPHETHSQRCQFTLKFRVSSSASWEWVKDKLSIQDGEIYFQPEDYSSDLSEYLSDLSPDLEVHSVASEVQGTLLWSIVGPVPAARSSTSGHTSVSLGIPRTFSRWFALVRIWSPWLAPRHGQGKFSPAEDAILSSFLRWDGLHVVVLAVSGLGDVLTVLKTGQHGNVILSARNDAAQEAKATAIVAVGTSFESAMAAVMYRARTLIHEDMYIGGELEAEMKASIDGVKADWMENWYDSLTYCTWNGLGQNLNEAKILNALDILEDSGIKITNLLIDDNWQSLDNEGQSQFKRGMTDFEANKEGFPQGLRHCTSEIREKHPHIQHIGVWHALMGYWGGISPTGKIAKEYKVRQVRKRDRPFGGIMTVVDADDVQRFYDDFYRFLQSAGIDSVKTDSQFFLDELDDAEDRRKLTKPYQDAWMISSLRYFSIKVISCMSQIPQAIFHSQLPTNKPRFMLRNSDDFFPAVPASHPWHIFVNAHNSLLTNHLNVLPDWDMFQTSHPYSSFHAAARCISGGPLYITDEPGKHDVNLISQMTARTAQGKTVILRPSVIGKAVGIYTSYDEARLLRVATYFGSKGSGTSLLAVFNVGERVLTEFVNINEFPGIEDGEEYIVRGHRTGELTPVLKLSVPRAVLSLEIFTKGWEILSAYPVRSFELSENKEGDIKAIKVAVLGLLGKMTGAAAVLNSDMRMEKNDRIRISSSIKALGVLGIYISDLRSRSLEETILVTILGKGIPLTMVSSSASEPVLEIDVERAWNELGFQSKWSNEIPVEVFIY